MTIISVLLLSLSSTLLAGNENKAPHCRYPTETTIYEQYVLTSPKGNCEIVSLEVLTGRECKKFVKEKVGQCYQLGKIYDRNETPPKSYKTCFGCQSN
jgi:hypothetical protein